MAKEEKKTVKTIKPSIKFDLANEDIIFTVKLPDNTEKSIYDFTIMLYSITSGLLDEWITNQILSKKNDVAQKIINQWALIRDTKTTIKPSQVFGRK